jgi:outer membrane protein assembly factor BamA
LKIRFLPFIFFVILLNVFLFNTRAVAQEKYRLEILGIKEDINYSKKFSDSLTRSKELNRVVLSLYSKGYVSVLIDSVINDSLKQVVFISAGPRYEWVYLRKGNIPSEILNDIKFKEKNFFDRPVREWELSELFEKTLRFAEDHGYPFAAIKLDSLTIKENKIYAVLDLELNNQIRIDSIRLHGKKVISERYLTSYIGIKEGDLYDETKVRQMSTRIRELPFVREQGPAQLYFKQKTAEINFFLDKKNANQFDGLVGFQPKDDGSGKISFIGQAHLKLLNAFKRGELLDIETRSLQDNTQDLKLRFTYPFIFSSPFGIDLGFDLHKQDTTFIDVTQEIGIQYLLNGGNYVKLFFRNKNSSLLSTKKFENSTTLPEFADVSSTLYGIGIKYEALDYRPNPRKGYSILGSMAAGTKTIRKNAIFKEELYDSLNLNTTQYKLDVKIDYFLNLYRNHVLNLGVQSGILISEDIFQNELYRFGGINDLRGFDEQSILASQFMINKIEYRYLLEQNSYFSLFYNHAFYRNKSRRTNVEDDPKGFGAGLSFETKAGIFTLSYALGQQFNNPVSLQSGKIHFGIINYF